MDSGANQETSSTPQPLPAIDHLLETDSQFNLNEILVNNIAEVLHEPIKEEDLDMFLRQFDPNVVESSSCADLLQEDTNSQQPASEFDDLPDPSYDKTLQAVPSLIRLLDAEVNNADANNADANNADVNNADLNNAGVNNANVNNAEVNKANHAEQIHPTESSMANIGTLHAELPNFGSDLREATAASSNVQDNTQNYTSLVRREEHFSLRQAQDTWNHISSTATNQTMELSIKTEGNSLLYSGSYGQTTSVQASLGTAFTNFHFGNRSHYSPYDNDSTLFAQNTLRSGSFKNFSLPYNSFINNTTPKQNLMEDQKHTGILGGLLYPGFFKNQGLFGNTLRTNIKLEQEKHPDVFSPGPFSGLNTDPLATVQAPNDKLKKGGSTNMCTYTNLFGNSLYSANPEPVTNFNSAQVNTYGQIMAPTGHRTCGCSIRARPRRRRGCPCSQELTDSTMSPHADGTAEANHGWKTTTGRRPSYHCEIEKPVKKRNRKTATKATESSGIKTQKKKRSPT